MQLLKFIKIILFLLFFQYLAFTDGNHASPGVILAGDDLSNTTDGDASNGDSFNPNGCLLYTSPSPRD